jgi:hypothetical protein
MGTIREGKCSHSELEKLGRGQELQESKSGPHRTVTPNFDLGLLAHSHVDERLGSNHDRMIHAHSKHGLLSHFQTCGDYRAVQKCALSIEDKPFKPYVCVLHFGVVLEDRPRLCEDIFRKVDNLALAKGLSFIQIIRNVVNINLGLS